MSQDLHSYAGPVLVIVMETKGVLYSHAESLSIVIASGIKFHEPSNVDNPEHLWQQKKL